MSKEGLHRFYAGDTEALQRAHNAYMDGIAPEARAYLDKNDLHHLAFHPDFDEKVRSRPEAEHDADRRGGIDWRASGSRCFAPTAVAGTAGTGILDASGSEIMKELSTYGPSQAAKAYQAIQAAGAAHPLAAKLLAYSLTSLGLGKIAHSLGWVGQQAP